MRDDSAAIEPLPAVADGGPMDGTVLGAAGPDEFEVVTADRSRWRYRRTSREQRQPDGRIALVYDCAGRI